jgi:hypothetical protein
LKTNYPKLETEIDDESINFDSITLDDSTFSEILSIFLVNQNSIILTPIAEATLDAVNMEKVNKKIDKFINAPNKVKWKKISKVPVRLSSKKIEFVPTEDTILIPNVVEEISKLWAVKNKLGTTLNYFR